MVRRVDFQQGKHLQLPFVQCLHVKAMRFKPAYVAQVQHSFLTRFFRDKVSSWNVDGEILLEPELEVQVSLRRVAAT